MENLHQYICQQAFDRAQKPSLPAGFIGPIPPPPTSKFIGQRWLREDPPNEPTIRVMFSCHSTQNGESRHVMLHLKSSVTEESLAKKLCQIFEVPANGGVITKTIPRFMPGLCPLTDPERVYSHAEVFEALHSTMTGFYEVTVVPTEAMSTCTNCGARKATTPSTLQHIRQWCFGLNSLCGRCFRSGASADNVTEACLPDGRILRRFRF